MTTPFFAEELDSGSRCSGGHPLMLVAEGYAYCCPEAPLGIPTVYYAWRLTPPATDGRCSLCGGGGLAETGAGDA